MKEKERRDTFIEGNERFIVVQTLLIFFCCFVWCCCLVLLLADFLDWMKQNVTKGGNDELLFSPNTTTIRPGVLVLVNDIDWELLDTTENKVFTFFFWVLTRSLVSLIGH